MVKAPWETYGVFPLEPGFLAPTFPQTLDTKFLAEAPGLMGWVPSGYVKIAIENGPFIVSFPIKNGDFP